MSLRRLTRVWDESRISGMCLGGVSWAWKILHGHERSEMGLGGLT